VIQGHLLHGGRGDASIDSAKAIVVLNSEVTALSPVSSPGVLHEPEVLRLVITNQKDSVVRSAVGAVIWRSSDDSSVVREQQIGIKGDGQRSVGNEVGHDLSDISAEGSPVGNDSNIWLSSLASSLLSSVGIVSLISKSCIGDDILIGEPWESSSTSTVAKIGFRLQAAVRAIDDPLFRQRNEFVLGKEPLSLNVLSSREGPARTAAGLVLNGSNGTLLAPIPGGGNSAGFNLGDSVVWPEASVLSRELGKEHLLLEFSVAHVRILVDSKRSLGMLSVQLGISSQVCLEVLEANLIFLRSGIGFVKLSHEFLKQGLISAHSLCVCESHNAQGDSEQQHGSHFR